MKTIYLSAVFINVFLLMAHVFAQDLSGSLFTAACGILCYIGYKNSPSHVE
tara:strand:- start:83777 stop:83929 length:153 start_codon:yes stop_codon:yes gene_type:complete